jgi:hypothetical protein
MQDLKNDIKNILADLGADSPKVMFDALHDGVVLEVLERKLGDVQTEVEELVEELR